MTEAFSKGVAVLQVCGDTRDAKGVVADLRGDSHCLRAAADHGESVGLR